ncbi:MAG: hypothetical protein COT91_01155 [Candidatus Doudnabacteria bacterium CG10_big_fil_rev_8_21_14_0_10_41_10]|uniref:Glycogen debranching enzyme C-terminal domain-containing protein n=1 Tax=Candidatus Doudnabacteria bacterium CG10_big_fil_rev_8_21_14_0_10_41_10 TaxID=1974551 RepID=A0A2H0VGQ5_9BACT|nr:MAG: hypothetical protein COT91_01155 [Candidatus Doudnabacteria bacterium CG10_big_fil_rev_8_21_14_0_10_41_10]
MSVVEEGYQQAIKVLEHCVNRRGFSASGLPGGYEALWARDSMITSIGASLAGEKFKTPFAKSLVTLAKNQSGLGQIPNAVGDYNLERQSDVTFNTIDSTLWYLIGHHAYSKKYHDLNLINKYQSSLKKALAWLSYQDPNEDKLIVQQPTMDWQDAFPHKYGRVLNTLALYYAALKIHDKMALAKHIKKVINGKKYNSLYDKTRGYYLPWVWKGHDGDREQGTWFDTFGNILAIVTGLATRPISLGILRHIEKNKINKPFPCKTIHPPIKPNDKEWHSYFSKCAAKTPHHYLNGGIWPYIGGWYIAALVKTGQLKKAGRNLQQLALANRAGKHKLWEFNEWLSGQTGKPMGVTFQGWSAGSYLFAYHCLKQKKIPFFL